MTGKVREFVFANLLGTLSTCISFVAEMLVQLEEISKYAYNKLST